MTEAEMDLQHDYFLMEIKGMMMRSVGEEPSCGSRKNRSRKEEINFEVQNI